MDQFDYAAEDARRASGKPCGCAQCASDDDDGRDADNGGDLLDLDDRDLTAFGARTRRPTRARRRKGPCGCASCAVDAGDDRETRDAAGGSLDDHDCRSDAIDLEDADELRESREDDQDGDAAMDAEDDDDDASAVALDAEFDDEDDGDEADLDDDDDEDDAEDADDDGWALDAGDDDFDDYDDEDEFEALDDSDHESAAEAVDDADDLELSALDAGLDMFDAEDDDIDNLDDEDDHDVITIRPHCVGVKRVRVRKDASGRAVFTRGDLDELCQAARRASAQASNVAAALDRIWFQKGIIKMPKRRRAWRANASIVRWFGSSLLTRRQVRVTRRRVRRIKRFFSRGIVFVVNREQTGKKSYFCKANRLAYAWGGSRVFLCPLFFQNQRRQQAMTIIHELVHKLGWPHARLPGVGKVEHEGHRDRALSLARRRPIRARHSPVNYAFLYDEFTPPF